MLKLASAGLSPCGQPVVAMSKRRTTAAKKKKFMVWRDFMGARLVESRRISSGMLSPKNVPKKKKQCARTVEHCARNSVDA